MPVERVPGFWDSLGAGVQRGVERYDDQQKMKQQHDEQNASLAAQLFGMGATDSASLQGTLAQTGVKANVLPGKAERRKAALDTPGAIQDMSDEQRRELGFQTRTENKQDVAQGATADVAKLRADAMVKFAGGGDLNDNEAELTGLKTKGDRELEQLGKMDPFLEHVGERYVAGAINQNPGGIISGGQAKATSEKAYADYVANRAASGLGTLTPQQIEYTKSYFDRATQNAVIAQTKLDIAREEADAQRIHANAAGRTAGQNQGMQWFKALSTAEEGLRKQQADLLKANPAILMALNDPKFAAMPMIAGPLQAYQELGRKAEAYRAGQSQLGDGTVPSNMNELIGQAQQDAAGPPPPRGGQRPTQPGQTVVGATPGQSGNVNLGAQPASSIPPEQISQAAQILAQAPNSISALQERVKNGQLTQDAYMKIVQAAAALKKKR